jgi:DNA mismatch repair protein MutS
VHLDATEHKGDLIFLHAVRDGPANQSYGLQVASLAGVPKTVIQRARKVLRALEAQQAAGRDTPQGQLALDVPEDDEPPPQASAALDALDALDPDSMSPREALDALYELKSLTD